MRKLRIYLDTSVISHLFAEDAPEKMNETLLFWENVKQGKYETYISNAVIEELNRNKEPKLSILYNYMAEIQVHPLEETKEVLQLVDIYETNNLLPKKSHFDRLHIAYAVTSGCDLLLSWNFSHLANIDTVNKVKSVNAINNYKEMLIVPPTMLLGEGEV